MSLLRETLKTAAPLNSVVFIHDYVQLTFQEVTLSIYCPFSLVGPGDDAVSRGDKCFCDAVVGLIEDRVVDVEESAEQLDLLFDSGRRISMMLADEEGPESFALFQPRRPTVVG
ncbi:MAG: hypothetical protein QNK18_08930 [Gammaproteobacteria bacterium]|nr:hypothetical protein [Gammaproteobacteria bacterium]MDJ0891299.1 hypothetical protein [Gammaproteobacteria bacterium]